MKLLEKRASLKLRKREVKVLKGKERKMWQSSSDLEFDYV